MPGTRPDKPEHGGSEMPLPTGYPQLLADIKTRIHQARTRAALSVNAELVRLYWGIGKLLVERQRTERWGSSVIEQLSRDLQEAFPALRGFSKPNLWKMRALYLAYGQEDTILSQPVRESARQQPPDEIVRIPWGHNVLLITRLREKSERLW